MRRVQPSERRAPAVELDDDVGRERADANRWVRGIGRYREFGVGVGAEQQRLPDTLGMAERVRSRAPQLGRARVFTCVGQ